MRCIIIKLFSNKEGVSMTNVLGIITEYNPFHNGHLYQIEEVKRRLEAIKER